MFDQLFAALSGGAASLVKLALGFLVLPYFFLLLGQKVEEAYRSAWASLRTSSLNAFSSDGRRLSQRLESLQEKDGAVFRIDLWLVVAAAIYLCGIFSLGDLATYSTLISDSSHASFVTGSSVVESKPPSSGTSEAEQVRGSLNAYGMAILLVCSYYLYSRYVKIVSEISAFERELFDSERPIEKKGSLKEGNPMPPSGYDHQQVDHISEFLRSCSRALLNEAYDRNETMMDALSREIASIEREFADKNPTQFQQSVLRLTLDFYSYVLCDGPDNVSTFRNAVDKAVSQVGSEVTAIHILESPT